MPFMYCQKIIPCIFCLLFCHPAAAQPDNFVFRHITKSSGLPAENITSLAQDSSGFIWIGTYEGLYRYDGFNFKAYTHMPGNPNSIPINAISKICVTKQGLLWIATIEGGIASIDRNGRIIRVINSSTTPLFTKESDYVNDIKEDKDGNIWCSTIDGLFRTSVKGKTNRFRLITSSYKDNAFGDIVFDASGKLWIGS